MSFVLLLAVPFGAIILDKDSRSLYADPVTVPYDGDFELIGNVSDNEYNILDGISGNGYVVLEKGYVYQITIAGGAGGNGVGNDTRAGGSGGNGAVVIGWLDLRNATQDVIFYYETGTSGGTETGGSPNGGNGGTGSGGGGGASFFYTEGGDLVLVAGAGGGGSVVAGNASVGGGNAGYNDSNVYTFDDGSIVYYAGNGTGTFGGAGGGYEGSDVGGNGAARPGVIGTGGGGGGGYAGGAGAVGLGGGGGGSSFVSSALDHPSASANSDADGWISISKYSPVGYSYTVSGQVQDSETEQGLSAIVYFKIGNENEKSLKTNEDGTFTISVLKDQILVITDVYVQYYTLDVQDLEFTQESEATITLTHNTYTVSGYVIDKKGDPVDAIIFYTISGAEYNIYTVDGKYTITVPEGQTVIITDAVAYGYAIETPSVEFTEETEYDIVLISDVFVISGYVIDEDGFLTEGATVWYRVDGKDPEYVLTDEYGYYEIIISRITDGRTVVIIDVEFFEYVLVSEDLGPFDDDTELLELQIYRTYVVSGQVTLDGEGVKITIIYEIDGVEGSVVTNDDGTFTIPGIRFDKILVIKDVLSDAYALDDNQTLSFDEDNNVAELIIIPVYSVSGKILYEDGNSYKATIYYNVDGVEGSVVTNDDGTFTINKIYAGRTLTITEVVSDYFAIAEDQTLVFTEHTVNIEISMIYEYFYIFGVITDYETGAGLAGVEITYTIDGVTVTTTTDNDGYYLIFVSRLTDGRTLEITELSFGNYVPYSDLGLLGSFKVTNDDLNIVLIRTYTVSIQIVDIEDYNGLKATIGFTIGGVSDSVETADDGAYTWTGIRVDQTLTIVTVTVQYYTLISGQQLVYTDDTIIILELSHDVFSVSGKVLDQLGNGIKATVEYEVDGVPYFIETDDAGNFSIEGIYSGKVLVITDVRLNNYLFANVSQSSFEETTDGVVAVIVRSYTLTIEANEGGSFSYIITHELFETREGTFSVNEDGIYVLIIPVGAIVEITPIPDNGYTFSWETDEEGTVGSALTVSDDVVWRGTFSKVEGTNWILILIVLILAVLVMAIALLYTGAKRKAV